MQLLEVVVEIVFMVMLEQLVEVGLIAQRVVHTVLLLEVFQIEPIIGRQ